MMETNESYRDWTKANWEFLTNDIASVNWLNLFNQSKSSDEYWQTFSDIINMCIDRSVPIKTPCAKRRTFNNNIIYKLMAKKRALWRIKRCSKAG